MISGRYANLGPEVLAEAGVLLVDRVGTEGVGRHQGRLPDPRRRRGRSTPCSPTARPRSSPPAAPSTSTQVHSEMDQARSGLAVQLETLTHNTTEFLRREQDLLLHGRGAARR